MRFFNRKKKKEIVESAKESFEKHKTSFELQMDIIYDLKQDLCRCQEENNRLRAANASFCREVRYLRKREILQLRLRVDRCQR